jgi:hypothetical protein
MRDRLVPAIGPVDMILPMPLGAFTPVACVRVAIA